jgi:hypothetical protein
MERSLLNWRQGIPSLADNLSDWMLTFVMAWICHAAVPLLVTLTMELHMELHVEMAVVTPAVAWDLVGVANPCACDES